MTTKLTTQTPEALQRIAEEAAAKASAAQAELERRAAEKADRLKAVVDTWEVDLIGKHRALDEQLVNRGGQHSDEFDQAVLDRDLPAALTAWINEKAMRYARQAIRVEAQGAEDRQRTGKGALPDLRIYDADLMSRLEDRADRAASILGAELAEQLIGQRPSEVD